MHFVGFLLAASLFTVGIALFIVTFWRHGLPSEEAAGLDPADRVTSDLVPAVK